ncbi:MAG: TIGR02646 family protein [Magnetococcales bacterium]|nr:TIGR02646 family protein [Magnetococcales bacterium]
MKTIQRNRPAPPCLGEQAHSQPWQSFIGSACHQDLDKHLRQEQQSLCCYCEGKIEAGDSHIEHMEPRNHNQRRTYDFDNLAISCNGGRVQHCGHYKDDKYQNPNYRWNTTQFADPHDPATAGLFQYLSDGSIVATAANPAQAKYMIGYLGLDCAHLVDRRKSHARNLLDILGAMPNEELVTWLRQHYLHPDANGQSAAFYSLSKAILDP